MQTSYNVEMDKAFEGMLADSGRIDALSKTISGTDVGFGLGVTFGAVEGTIKKLAAITDKFAGVVIHKHVTDGIIAEKDTVAVLRKGRIYVKVEESVVVGDPVHVRAIATGLEVVGAFRKSVDGTDTFLVTGAKFLSDAAAGEFAILDLNLPE